MRRQLQALYCYSVEVYVQYDLDRFQILVLYENIDQILSNKLHEPMHYKIGVYTLDTCSILC